MDDMGTAERWSNAFCCPDCGGHLADNPTGLVCDTCSATWPVRDGIPCLLRESQFEGYDLAPRMKDLNELAAREGWQVSVRQFMGETERAEYSPEYICSEARADFRFLLPAANQRGTIVNIGSGWGNIAVAFARMAEQVLTLDMSRENLCFVRIRAEQEGLSNIVVAQADAAQLPLLPRSCDVVLLMGVLEWLARGRSGDPQALQKQSLQRIYQALEPGGCLCIGTENRFSFKYFLGSKEPHTDLRFVTLLPKPLANGYSRAVRGRDYRELTYSSHGLAQLLQEAGFDHVAFWYPIPNYRDFRYLTDHYRPGVTRFVLNRLRGHPKFTDFYYLVSHVAALIRMHTQLSSCFSVIAYKDHD